METIATVAFVLWFAWFAWNGPGYRARVAIAYRRMVRGKVRAVRESYPNR